MREKPATCETFRGFVYKVPHHIREKPVERPCLPAGNWWTAVRCDAVWSGKGAEPDPARGWHSQAKLSLKHELSLALVWVWGDRRGQKKVRRDS